MLLFAFVLVLLVDLHVEADLVVEGCDGVVQCWRRRGRAGRHRLAIIGREISHRSFGIRHSFVIPLAMKNQFWAIQSQKEWNCSWNVRLFELARNCSIWQFLFRIVIKDDDCKRQLKWVSLQASDVVQSERLKSLESTTFSVPKNYLVHPNENPTCLHLTNFQLRHKSNSRKKHFPSRFRALS